MKVLIVEDEVIASKNLANILNQIDNDITIIENTTSIKSSKDWLNNNPFPDLIFMDIQLNDGLSFEIFNQLNITCPVVFTTSFDEYMVKSFNHNCIDYILKPITKDQISKSLHKYNQFKSHFNSNLQSDAVLKFHHQIKSRLTVRKGNYFTSIKTTDIAYIYSENKISFVITIDDNRYISDSNLSELELFLDSNIFFRANRQFIINANAINRFKSFNKGKIIIEMTPKTNEDIIVSQENAPNFRSWINQVNL